MSKYLVRLTPAEPYFFGGENTFRFDNSGFESESYYISSLPLPSQTTVLGMLRYVLLEQNGILSPSGKYSLEQHQRNAELIGEKPYNIASVENSLGAISSVSPLFITDSENNIYIPLPRNHNTVTREKHYSPIRMSETKTAVGENKMALPDKADFKVKSYDRFFGEDLWFMRVSDGEVTGELISQVENVGIDKNNKDKAFFKKCYCQLKSGYSFAFTVETDIKLNNGICHMGRERSCFIFEAVESELDIVSEVKKINGADVYYALSDLVIKRKLEYKDFALISTDRIRTLVSSFKDSETSFDDTKLIQKALTLRPHEELFTVIKAGSVFYEDISRDYFYSDTYGLNTIVKLGGNEK